MSLSKNSWAQKFGCLIARQNFYTTVTKRTFIFRSYQDVKNEGNVKVMPSKACESRRYLLRKDGFGFSLHHTVLYKGQSMYINYVNHLEAVFCIKGSGWIELVNDKHEKGNGVRYELKPGTMYGLDGHEKHWLGSDADEDTHFICAFIPPCDGAEAQNEQGCFPFIGADGVPNYDYWKQHEDEGRKVQVTIDAGYSKKL